MVKMALTEHETETKNETEPLKLKKNLRIRC